MRNYLSHFSALVVFLFAIIQSAFSQKLTGDGNVIKEQRQVPSFSKIQMDGVVNVYLKQGPDKSLTIEADQNLAKYIQTPVEGNTLYIKTADGVEIKEKTKLNVYVTFENIDLLNMNGIGNVKGENKFQLNNFVVENSGVGNLDLDLNCNNLEMEINGVGNAKFSGRVKELRIDQNGVGNIKAFDLIADVLRVQSNGVGNAEVVGEKEIYIDVNGIGNVSYKGDGATKVLNKNGSGNINRE